MYPSIDWVALRGGADNSSTRGFGFLGVPEFCESYTSRKTSRFFEIQCQLLDD